MLIIPGSLCGGSPLKEYILGFFGFVLIKYNLYVFLFVNFISVVIFKSSSYNARICQTQSNFSRFSSGIVVFFFFTVYLG